MKTQLRKNIVARRLALTEEAVQEKSAKILANLMSLEAFNASGTVMLYMDFRKEVQTKAIIDYCLNQGKKVVLPVVGPDKKNLLLLEIKSLDADMILSSYGILEPIIKNEHLKSLHDIDLLLAPGVAFDLEGYRLGYGGGYYDRLLENRPEHLLVFALAFDLQVIDSLPHDSHDQRVDGIVTESRLITINP